MIGKTITKETLYPEIYVISGPTASYKSEVALRLAKRIGGEIISADSVQVYRGLDIGSAKATRQQQEQVNHHLIDILEPDQQYDVVQFVQHAKDAIQEIHGRGKMPIIVGGTGFYVQALLYDIDFSEEVNDAIRGQLWDINKEQVDPTFLWNRLNEIDPFTASTIPVNNHKRIIRAIEFYQTCGVPLAEHNQKQRAKPPAYPANFFVMEDIRDVLYERIHTRVNIMIEQGLQEEVRNLLTKGIPWDCTSMQNIGYKEMVQCIHGAIRLDEAIEEIAKSTRHFAKRQITWFKREQTAQAINLPAFQYDPESMVNYICNKKRG